MSDIDETFISSVNQNAMQFDSEIFLAALGGEETAIRNTSNVTLRASNSFAGASPKVSETLQDTLVEFAMNFLLEQPKNPLKYCGKYFRRLERKKHTPMVYDVSGPPSNLDLPKEEEKALLDSLRQKRRCVYSESYDPRSSKGDFVKPVHSKSLTEFQGLLETSKKIFLFRSLDEDQLNDVLNALFKVEVPAGKTLIKQGEEGDYLYVIELGIFDVYKSFDGGEPVHVHTYQNEGFFGELALMYNQPRAATVQAVTDGIVWALDRATFRHLVLHSAFEKRRMYEEYLNGVPLFDELSPYEKSKIADALMSKKYQDGEVIIEEGDTPLGVHFVISGAASVRLRDENDEVIEVSRIQTGGHFGMFSLLMEKPYEETIVAEGETKLAFLDVQAFENVLGPCMDLLAAQAKSLQKKDSKVTGKVSSLMDYRTKPSKSVSINDDLCMFKSIY